MASCEAWASHRSPSTSLERSVGVATGVRVGGSHGFCALRGLLVGYCGGLIGDGSYAWPVLLYLAPFLLKTRR